VAEDQRRGRIYLPAEDMRRFGVSEQALAGAHATPELRSLLAFEVERARELLREGSQLLASVHGRMRIALAGYVAGGWAALEAIERARYEVLGGPPRASRARRALALARVLSSRHPGASNATRAPLDSHAGAA
jgi:phytoene/squalene synthetase